MFLCIVLFRFLFHFDIRASILIGNWIMRSAVLSIQLHYIFVGRFQFRWWIKSRKHTLNWQFHVLREICVCVCVFTTIEWSNFCVFSKHCLMDTTSFLLPGVFSIESAKSLRHFMSQLISFTKNYCVNWYSSRTLQRKFRIFVWFNASFL